MSGQKRGFVPECTPQSADPRLLDFSGPRCQYDPAVVMPQPLRSQAGLDLIKTESVCVGNHQSQRVVSLRVQGGEQSTHLGGVTARAQDGDDATAAKASLIRLLSIVDLVSSSCKDEAEGD